VPDELGGTIEDIIAAVRINQCSIHGGDPGVEFPSS